MQMVKKSIIVFVIAWIAIIVLMPKQELYYKLEEELAKHDIILNEDQIDEGLFSLKLKQVTVYYKGISVATIEEMKMATLLFYSCVKVDTLEVDSSLKAMVPQKTKEARATHSILSPLQISVEASGSFGAMEGSIDLSEQNMRLDFNQSKNLEMLKPRLRKEEKGWVYETSF
jgi:hypothetical protein